MKLLEALGQFVLAVAFLLCALLLIGGLTGGLYYLVTTFEILK
jgi:hypothetical protein